MLYTRPFCRASATIVTGNEDCVGLSFDNASSNDTNTALRNQFD